MAHRLAVAWKKQVGMANGACIVSSPFKNSPVVQVTNTQILCTIVLISNVRDLGCALLETLMPDDLSLSPITQRWDHLVARKQAPGSH